MIVEKRKVKMRILHEERDTPLSFRMLVVFNLLSLIETEKCICNIFNRMGSFCLIKL